MADAAVASGTLLGDALARIQREVDAAFDQFLPVPDDTRAPLIEAMRYAAIGGGKRVRPLLTVASAELYGVARDACWACIMAIIVVSDRSLMSTGELMLGGE